MNSALEKIRSMIGKDNHIISHSIKNGWLVASVGRKNVGDYKTPVSATLNVSVKL